MLYLTEIFCSIQGETSLAGLPTAFVRLSGCNLRCTWCDTPYSFKRGMREEVEAVLQKIESYGVQCVCVTGGEPLLQKNVYPLMTALCDRGYTVSLETGGSLSIETVDPRVVAILDVKCPGSGMSHKNAWKNLEILRAQDEVKFVIRDETDYLYSKEVANKYHLFSREKQPLFSPVHGILDPKLLVEWVLRDQLPIRLNLQLHKWIWDPMTRGV